MHGNHQLVYSGVLGHFETAVEGLVYAGAITCDQQEAVCVVPARCAHSVHKRLIHPVSQGVTLTVR